MIKRILVIIAAILFIILTFVTDFGLYLLLALVLAFVTWLLTKTGERKIGETIVRVGTAMVILPLLIMVTVFVIKSYFNPEATEKLASSTINAMTNYIGEKCPSLSSRILQVLS
jgi:predicted PurR-regulated permease PerM